MILREKKWIFPEVNKNDDENSVLERLLRRRGFLKNKNPSLPDDCLKWHDPFLFPDMEKACERIEESFRENQSIVIYGDYDTDGISAASLLYLFFAECHLSCRFVIPERIQDGYGISQRYVEEFKSEKNILFISVDCGIRDINEVKMLCEAGVDVIVTDHHETGDELPAAIAILDAKREDSHYPFSQLCGAGVALKLAQALCSRGVIAKEKDWEKYIDLAGIGTVADVVPLRDENRLIVKLALAKMNQELRLGIKALLKASGRVNDLIVSSTIGYTLAPRINAAGRMGSALRSVELLISKDEISAEKIANELTQENLNRQEIERQIFQQVVKKLESADEMNVYENTAPIVVWDKNWHPGVIGIVASKLVDRYDRSVIIMTKHKDLQIYKGSARSCGKDNILNAILHAKEYAEEYGGHQKAAGVSVKEENLEKFAEKIREYVSPHDVSDPLGIMIDLTIKASEMTVDVCKEISQLEPFGEENSEPIFCLKNCKVLSVITRGNGQHLSLKLSCFENEKEYVIDSIYFRGGHLEKLYKEGSVVDILFSMSISIWKEKEKLSIIINDIRFSKTGFMLFDKPEVLEELFKNKLPLEQMRPLLKSEEYELSISKEDIKKVYIYLDKNFSEQILSCDYKILSFFINHTNDSNLTPFSLARILDIFNEASLIKIYSKDSKSVCFHLLSVSKKVKLTKTPTFNRMIMEGGVVT